MPYTNFCARSGGSNLNAGTRTGNTTVPGTAADLTYAGGSWVNTTRTLTVVSGDPVADGVAVDDYAAVDNGGSSAVYIARVSSRTSTTITLAASGWGSVPASGTCTIRIGGAHATPFLVTNTLTTTGILNTAGNEARINIMGTINLTTGIVFGASAFTMEGFTTNYDDNGIGTIDGGTSGSAYSLFSSALNSATFRNLNFQNNGSTSSAALLSTTSGARLCYQNCLFKNSRGTAYTLTTGTILFDRCRFENVNQSNTPNLPAISLGAGTVIARNCEFINNTSTNSSAIYSTSSGNIVTENCVFLNTGKYGIQVDTTGMVFANHCAFKNGSNNAIHLINQTRAVITNCVFTGNNGYGISITPSSNNITVLLLNNAFYNNASGQTQNLNSDKVVGSITLLADPFQGTDFTLTDETLFEAAYSSFHTTLTSNNRNIGPSNAQFGGGGGVSGARIFGGF